MRGRWAVVQMKTLKWEICRIRGFGIWKWYTPIQIWDEGLQRTIKVGFKTLEAALSYCWTDMDLLEVTVIKPSRDA